MNKNYNNKNNNKEIQPIGYMVHLFGRLFKQKVKEICLKNGVNSTYADIIKYLHKYPEGACQNDIVDHVHLKAPTISLTLKQMERENLIERKNDLIDSRKTLVVLTDEGVKFSESFRACLEEAEACLLRNIHEEEVIMFRDTFSKMIKNLEDDK